MKTQHINPTLYRELQKPVIDILQEPADITNKLFGPIQVVGYEPSESEWERAWMNYQPIMIAEYPKPSCDLCSGTGKRGVTIHTENGNFDADDQPCSFCNGTGIEDGVPPKAGTNCAYDNGFREACTQILAMADDYFVDGTPAHTRFCLTVRRMYDGRL